MTFKDSFNSLTDWAQQQVQDGSSREKIEKVMTEWFTQFLIQRHGTLGAGQVMLEATHGVLTNGPSLELEMTSVH